MTKSGQKIQQIKCNEKKTQIKARIKEEKRRQKRGAKNKGYKEGYIQTSGEKRCEKDLKKGH